ncbi:MAG: 4-(cytidine 5'-diphospho)-2-C-methyl-D-erythritol kinase [Fermentimonas sp.]|jgi:4-diphosphocytidyl-2-C-methyl-D-erythritol kinase
MISFPNAKINLGLNILRRREDGYHDIETLMYPIGLTDALEIVTPKSDERDVPYRLFADGRTICGDVEDNLVVKAMKVMFDDAGKDIPNVDIHLLKNIPMGAGMGGGSADAAFMLKMLNDKFELGYDTKGLERLALKVGADCPFFIVNEPALASGIGDKLERVDLDLSGWHLLVVLPDVVVSTKEAYSWVVPKQPEVSLREVVNMPVSEWRGVMKNDFEDALFDKYPDLCAIKEEMYELGAVYASMSGSGSALYGLFEEAPDIGGRFEDCYVWQCVVGEEDK